MKVLIPEGVVKLDSPLAQSSYSRTLDSLAPLFLLLNADHHGDAAAEAGTLAVNIPFCGFFGEAPLLYRFVRQRLSSKRWVPPVHRIVLRGFDINGREMQTGKEKLTLALQQDDPLTSGPEIHFEFRTCDLSTEALPDALLTLAMHPEMNNNIDVWQKILQNVWCHSGASVFCVYTEYELSHLQLCVQRQQLPHFSYANPHALALPVKSEKAGDRAAAFGWVLVAWCPEKLMQLRQPQLCHFLTHCARVLTTTTSSPPPSVPQKPPQRAYSGIRKRQCWVPAPRAYLPPPPPPPPQPAYPPSMALRFPGTEYAPSTAAAVLPTAGLQYRVYGKRFM